MAKGVRGELSPADKNLVRRYLIWCYKTTKEDLDKVDRYFTQEMVDHVVIKELMRSSEYKSSVKNPGLRSLVEGFVKYAAEKKANADKRKFLDQGKRVLRADYQYLQLRLKAIEEAARHFLGGEGLKEIQCLYEQEMTNRILEAREHT